jgi:hypothetical protein
MILATTVATSIHEITKKIVRSSDCPSRNKYNKIEHTKCAFCPEKQAERFGRIAYYTTGRRRMWSFPYDQYLYTGSQHPIRNEIPTYNYNMWISKLHGSRWNNSSNKKPTPLRVVSMLQIFAVHLPWIYYAKCYVPAIKGHNVVPLSPFPNGHHNIFSFVVFPVTQYPMIW